VVEADAVVDTQRARVPLGGVAFHMGRVVNVLDLVLGLRDLAGKHPGGRGLPLVLLALRRREGVPALRADAVGGVDHRLALWALLGRRFAAPGSAVLDLQG